MDLGHAAVASRLGDALLSLISCFKRLTNQISRLYLESFTYEVFPMKSIKVLLPSITAILLLSTSSAYALSLGQLARMSPSQKKQAQQYFRTHSLDFSSVFKRYHPGPYWILKNKSAFRLTPRQIQGEVQLKNEMAMRTIEDSSALQHAYDKYKKDASTAHPTLAMIKSDIIRVGKAETQLAWEMVPYHLQGYALLNPAQKATYTQLSAKTWAQHHRTPDKRAGGQ
ncbi:MULTISPECIES: hypothetical protein [Acidithiobacillus]|jgi:hypothetical protein|uniref:Uncharacterized protein n=2 Tax=Acidithiobacillus ferrooxidans TaxID=920 RepID=B7J6T7_ACIF2|nr:MULTISPECIES: hypothetical protein [Acidithiobacillus]ACK80764.1 hypothetical protein AFE_0876 [Acidithiobacillus ferrooxidans ATCC 23270]MCR0968857.1 hypothetical protein [Acidithiobacillus ferrooxidans]MCR1349146.1 hypothetical protein [Acidithiobacillus ferrooxidans]MCR1350718.1 hypothetical protein [Acidithiobacillus ferrooxidans]MCR1355005.1 hypothetical protein [Acidithiobacillus ferrooxidans]